MSPTTTPIEIYQAYLVGTQLLPGLLMAFIMGVALLGLFIRFLKRNS